MSIEQKVLQPIIDELESIKAKNEVMSIAIACLFSEINEGDGQSLSNKLTNAFNDLNKLNPPSSRMAKVSRLDAYSQALSMMRKSQQS